MNETTVLSRRPTDWYRLSMFGLAGLILAVAVPLFLASLGAFQRVGYVGIDAIHYMDATRRWLEVGTPYPAAEVAAPFDYSSTTFLHPPIALYLFAPFTVLPLVLWWVIPIGIVLWSVWSWKPRPWTWPLFALALAWPRFHGALIVGNTDLWVCAFLCLGLRFWWPAVLIVVKPSLGFLALFGAWRRSWWLALGIVALVSLPLGTLWLDWLHVLVNSPGDWTYSLPNVLWVGMPAVAWFSWYWTQTREPDSRIDPYERHEVAA